MSPPDPPSSPATDADADANVTAKADAERRRHDQFFKQIFGRVDNARELLREVLPTKLVHAIDWSTLASESETHVDDALNESRSDLVFSVRLHSGRKLVILALLEHQSRSDPRMAARVHRYLVHAETRWVANHPDEGLPLGIPIVIYAGEKAWSAPRWLHEHWGEEERGLLPDELIPKFTYLLYDLTQIRPETLLERPMSALVRSALRVLQGVAQRNLLARAERLGELFMNVRDAHGPRALRPLLNYLTKTEGRAVRKAIAKMPEPIQTDTMMSLQDEWLQEGMQQGMLEAQRRTLALLLEQKFGEVPAQVRTRLESATSAELERWVRRVITTATIDDLFA